MIISLADINHIAELAKLELSPAEKERFGQQLGSILEYVEQLQEIDTSQVEPTAQVSGLTDVWRQDEVKSWDRSEVEDALSQGKLEGGQIKVKRVL
jgi:aspartyl-tRNA(Asn)/glutamyl-tRNA(Gln) amidotransferase subunit C